MPAELAADRAGLPQVGKRHVNKQRRAAQQHPTPLIWNSELTDRGSRHSQRTVESQPDELPQSGEFVATSLRNAVQRIDELAAELAPDKQDSSAWLGSRATLTEAEIEAQTERMRRPELRYACSLHCLRLLVYNCFTLRADAL